MKFLLKIVFLLLPFLVTAQAELELGGFIVRHQSELIAFYKQLHQYPELSFEEKETSKLL